MPRKKKRYPSSQKVAPVRPLPPPPANVTPVNKVNPVTGSLALRPFNTRLLPPPPGEEGIVSQMQRREIKPMPYSHTSLFDIGLVPTDQPTDPAILSAMEKYQEQFPLPTESQARGCNLVAAVAVLAFAAFIIGVILWLASL